MSQLDAYFGATASRGIPVQQEPAMGESTLEPGYLYLVVGAHVTTFYGIAARKLADVTGKRLALKVIADAEEPPNGELKISAPAGQLVEDDDGVLTSLAAVGTTDRGNYREWLCDPDGNWLMVARRPAGGAMPFGQIVIQGVPVMIQGVPLVLSTPPPTRAVSVARPVVAAPAKTRSALPVTVAAPAVIVPRAPLALPRATVTVELVDAFADASLEMDAEGDQFRVASTLQAAVDAMRFAFTLRTASVDSASFEEIGILRFDAAPFGGALRLVAELEVSAPGQSVELQLVNLSAPAVIATLSSASLTTEHKSVLVTLPLVEQLYSVRLQRVGGVSGQRVACRAAYFEQV